MQHWAMVVVAMLCVWAASLAKEIGITVTATVVLYDAFLVPFDRAQPPCRCPDPKHIHSPDLSNGSLLAIQ